LRRVAWGTPDATPARAMPPSGHRCNVLIVDDEESLAWSLSTRLGKVRPRYSIDMAFDGTSALARLHRQPVDLLVADVRMPGMSGIELVLAAHRENPDLPVIVMTAFKTTDVHRLSETSTIQFLEKPFPFETFLGYVDRALATHTGFSGAISVQTLPDIVQLYILSSTIGVLVVRYAEGEGRIWFDRGVIPHAVTENHRGEEAFFEIMMWSGGEFSMRAGVEAPERSVTASWQELLMESCRRIDERVRAESSPEIHAKGWTLAPPSLDAPAATSSLDFEDAHPNHRNQDPKETPMNIKDSLSKLNQIDGFVGAALVDSESGMLLGSEGGGTMNLEVAAAGNTEVVRAKRKTMNSLGIKDGIEDILISLAKQYHLIRPLRSRTTLFFYLVLDRQRANLAMARIGLADVEKELQV
jgi:CheY-like chemotaxis protein/predicted regulator of Ras-like GTPase activity (Roadblock/LC7/MglB family)